MSSREKVTGYLWVRICIAFGLLLGLLLLGQTVGTYLYFSRSMVRQEAQREADRKAQSIARATRLTGSRDASTLSPVIDELVKESPGKIAWIRVLGTDGKVIASGGNLKAAPEWTANSLRAASGRGPRQDLRATESGEVLLVVSPLRFGGPFFGRGGPPPDGARAGSDPGQSGLGFFPPDRGFGGRSGGPSDGASGFSGEPGRGRGPGGPYLETAIYLDGISVSFAPLLVPMGVGCSAALALLAAVIVIGLRFSHYIRGKQYEEELALARRVQNDLFPRENLPAGNVEFAARFVPAREVGGDLYDVFETADGGVAMVLGDVSGKGLSAALLMGVVQGAVRTSSDSELALHHEYSAERLNHLICIKTARERFVSLFWCYLNKDATLLSYINAGHLPALLVRERFGKPDVWRLEQGGGPVLGVLPGARYRRAEVAIEPGDILIVFSDGISEATNAQGDEFGEEGIIESAKRHWQKPAADICDGILADIRTFLDKELPHDDQTLMVVRLERVTSEKGPAKTMAVEMPALS